jgi:hypothetical protein
MVKECLFLTEEKLPPPDQLRHRGQLMHQEVIAMNPEHVALALANRADNVKSVNCEEAPVDGIPFGLA